VVAVLAPASPASASPCVVGLAAASVTPGLLYPVTGPLITKSGNQLRVDWNNGHTTGASWSILIPIASTCPGGISASGTLNGYCGHSAGTGTDTAGHLIAWTSLGGFLVLTNELTGVAHATPDPLIVNNNCLHLGSVFGTGPPKGALPSGATRFLVSGAVWRFNCPASQLTTTLTGLIPPQQSVLTTLPIHVPLFTPIGLVDNVHVSTPHGLHVHTSTHVCTGVPTKL
jgi:hypothetical protein